MSRNEREMRLKGAAINAVIDLSLQRAKDGVAMGVIADQKCGVLWAIYTLISAAATLGCRAGLSSAPCGRWWMLAYSSESGLSEVLLRETWTHCESHLFAPPEAG